MYVLIDSFDINSTQIGLNTETGELYLTDNFILFLYTKQLEIVNFSTPAHSLIRLFKKSEELGVYLNKQEALETYAIQSVLVKKVHETFNFFNNIIDFSFFNIYDTFKNINKKMNKYSIDNNLFFNKEHYQKIKSSSLYNEVNILKKVSSPGIDSSNEFVTSLSESDEDLYFMELKREDELFKKAKDSFDNLDFIKTNLKNENDISFVINTRFQYLESVISIKSNTQQYLRNSKDLPANVVMEKLTSKLYFFMYNSHLAQLSNFMYNCQLIKKALMNLRKNSYSNFIKYNRDPDYIIDLNKNINSINYAYVIKLYSIMKKHSEIIYFIRKIPINQAEVVYKLIKNLEKKHGQLAYPLMSLSIKISNIALIINENNFNHLSNICSDEITRLILLNSKELKKEFFQYSCDKFTITELNSGVSLFEEGAAQSNCVGGYGKLVRDKKNIILSIKYSNGKRVTVQLFSHFLYLINKNLIEDFILKNKDYNEKSHKSYFIQKNKLILNKGNLINEFYEFRQVRDYGNALSSMVVNLDALLVIADHFNIKINLYDLPENDLSISAEKYLYYRNHYNIKTSTLDLSSIESDVDNYYYFSDSFLTKNNSSLLVKANFNYKPLKDYLLSRSLATSYVNFDNDPLAEDDEDEIPF